MPKVHPIVFYTRTTAFGIIFFLGILAINLVQLPGRLLFPLRKVYRNYMRFTQRLFGSLILTLTFIFSPLSINLTGAHQGLKSNTFAPIIANHQIYTDWWYIWLLACFRDAHGEMKILLIERLSKLPLIGTVSKLILGWGMSCYEFVFLARKWQVDRPRIVKNLDLAQTDGNPLWLLVFPEGTVICDETVEKSKAFAQKNGLDYKHKYVLMPKSTGLFHILRSLRTKSEYLYDFTVGYSGHDRSVYAYDFYSPSVVFAEGNGPQSVHMHVDRFKIDDIPGISNLEYDPGETTTPEFEDWLRNRFIEKDQLLGKFFDTGSFPEKSADGSGTKQVFHLNPKLEDWLSISVMILASCTSLSWLFHKSK